ncbi:hypothetical protein L1887_59617 [Cichorium endivia]|nr:hypothetical protein L1887_59617 [Cichorium endivia]
MRLGTAGGPMEPVELVTDDLRVRLEPVVATSSEATEEASSSTTPKLWKGEWRDGVRLSLDAPVTALCSGLEVARSRSSRMDVRANGEAPVAAAAAAPSAVVGVAPAAVWETSLRALGRCDASSIVSDAAESERSVCAGDDQVVTRRRTIWTRAKWARDVGRRFPEKRRLSLVREASM